MLKSRTQYHPSVPPLTKTEETLSVQECPAQTNCNPMKRANFTFVKSAMRLAVSACLILLCGNVNAQCTLACNNGLQISVSATPTDGMCNVMLSADMLLENYTDALVNCTTAGTDSDFIITLMDGPAMVATGPSVLTVSGSAYDLNETYSYRVQAGANSCWGSLVIEDKAAPTLANCNDVTIDCTQEINSVTAPAPTAADNCTGATVQLIDESTNTAGQCTAAGVLVTRTYSAIDANGNLSTTNCVQNITIRRVTGVDFPEDIAWYCEDYGNNNNITNPTALTCTGLTVSASLGNVLDATSSPGACPATTGSGTPSVAEGAFCNYAVSNSDDTLSVCTSAMNTLKIIRTWSVLDWCTGTIIDFNDLNNSGALDIADEVGDGMDYNGDGDMLDMVQEEDNIQIIKVVDNVAPSITISPTADLNLSANVSASGNQNCRSTDFLPVPTVTDACGTATYQVFTPAGQANIVNNVPQVPNQGLAIGTHNITYVATDACGNTSELTIVVTVVDDITPTAVCDEITQVSVGGSGTALIFASTFDDGSNDNCGVDFFSVRRPNGVFGPSVSFTCADIATNPNMVTFRVTDFGGLTNECMVEVLVEDKIGPTLLSSPANFVITCDDYFENYAPALDIAIANNDTNPAVLSTNFGEPVFSDNCDEIVTSSFSRVVNSCGQGSITRTYSSTDASGNAGASFTQVITINHVNDWNIEFPADVDLVCEPGMDELDGANLGEPVVFNEDCELIATSVEDQTFNVVVDACYKIIRTYTAINWCVYDGDNMNDDVLFSPSTPRRFTDGGDGIVTFTQTIKVNDDVAPVITNPGTQEFFVNGSTDADNDCDIDLTLPEALVTDCSTDITVTYTSQFGTGRNLTNVAPGTYPITVGAVDNCGNASSIQYNITVTDNKAPTPYCVGGLIVELMPLDSDNDGEPDQGMLELSVADFDAGSFDNCTEQANLKFFGKLNDSSFAGSTDTIMLNCDDFGSQNLFLFVQDEAGNIDLCQTTLQVESIDNICGENEDTEIAGAIYTENDAAISGAMVEVNAGSMNMVSTDENGAYNLMVDAGTDVTVTPSYDTDADEGVTTFDLVLIRQHILTLQLLDSPYKMIAADANNSGTITASDLVSIKSVILGLSQEFNNNSSWVFVDAAYEFPTDWTLQDGYPAVMNKNNVSQDFTADFTAVKVGDVNASWTAFGDNSDERGANSMIINTQDASLAAGETMTFEFKTEDFAIAGYQFTLNFKGLELVQLEGAEEDLGIFANAITTSHEGANEGSIFALTFRATEDVRISEALSLTGDITKKEAYTEAGEIIDVELNFIQSSDLTFRLYQNRPNPVAGGSTTIGFDLAKAGQAVLTLQDLTGKVIRTLEGDYAAGYNQIILNKLNAAGVYTYTLAGEGFSATRKLIVH